MAVEFMDFSEEAKDALDEAVIAFLYTAAGELETQTKRNTKPGKYGKYDVKNSWKYEVDESQKQAKVGSTLEASYWEELGTGEYALNGDGRKGWWVYVEGNDTPRSNQKQYTKEEALEVCAYLRSEGLDAHISNGTEANRPLHRAFEMKKGWLKKLAEDMLKERVGE